MSGTYCGSSWRRMLRRCLSVEEHCSVIRYTWLYCENQDEDRSCSFPEMSDDLPRDRHAGAGHAVDHVAGDSSLDLLQRRALNLKRPYWWPSHCWATLRSKAIQI